MHILTFDIEEWFHLLDHSETSTEKQWLGFESRFESNLERVLAITTESTVNATFFCLGWIAEKYPQLIAKIAEQGYEIACHSSRHQLAYNQTPAEFRADLLKAKDQISSATGEKVTAYRVPGFSFTNDNLWAFDILSEEGFDVDCSIFPVARGHGGLPQFKYDRPCLIKTSSGFLREFPLNTKSILGNPVVFSGGGYFRLFPYFLLLKMFKDSEYAMTYFHPRDFDPNQPIIHSLSHFRKFKSYVGLKGAEIKLRKILDELDFIDVRTAVTKVNWSDVPIIDVNINNNID
jgi:peptidoglycan-N-acetylglucosamine deacetylase